MPSVQHERRLYEKLLQLEKEGWKTLTTGRKVPDAILISPDRGKIIALEVLGRKRRFDSEGLSKGWVWTGGKSARQKLDLYRRYDDILFVLFNMDNEEWHDEFFASDQWPEEMKYASGDKDA